MSAVKVLISEREVRTTGLLMEGHREVLLKLRNPGRQQDAEQLLTHLSTALLSQENSDLENQELPYGYWRIVLINEDGEDLAVWERRADWTELQPGAELAMTYWRSQHQVCDQHGAPFDPPHPEQLVALSVGVLEGDSVEAVRYPAPSHMSGWYIFTDRYSGNVDDLRLVHAYHLTASRPDLAQYIALPPGFCMTTGSTPHVWFEQESFEEGLRAIATDE